MTERSFKIEEVDEAPVVAKAPPLASGREPGHSSASGREPGHTSASGRAPDYANAAGQRDYLDGFLNKPAETVPADAPGGEVHDAVIAALRDIFDPEIPVNIYDLGLIYGVEVDGGHVAVSMTLTTPHCPVAETMPGEVEMRVMNVPGVATAEVNLVWDPAWDPGKMSDEAKLELGML